MSWIINGKEQWFFEDEIDLLDENGNVINQIKYKKKKFLIINLLEDLKYENKSNAIELLNPINFFGYLFRLKTFYNQKIMQ